MLVYPLEMAIYEGVKPFSDPYSYSVGGAGVQFCSPTGLLIIGGYHFVITIWGDFPRFVINRTSETRVDLDHCKGTWLILADFLFISVSMVNVSYNFQQVWLLSDYLLPGCIPILGCTNVLSPRFSFWEEWRGQFTISYHLLFGKHVNSQSLKSMEASMRKSFLSTMDGQLSCLPIMSFW